MRRLEDGTSRRGFTLIEIIVAFAIAALVAAAAAALLVTVIRGSDVSARAIATARHRAAVAERLRSDLESVYSIVGRSDLVFRVNPAGDDPETTAEAVWCRVRAHPGPGLEHLAEVRRVAYASDIVAGRPGLCLLRMDRPATGDPPADRVEWDILVDDLREFSIRMTAGDGAWTNRWDSEVRQALPRGVHVRVAAADLGTQPLEIRVAVPSAAGVVPAGGGAP